MEFSLLAAAAISGAAFWLVLRWEAKRGNAAGCALDLWDTGLMSAIVGLAAGRIAAMVLVGVNPVTNPGQVILIRSGVSTEVAVLGGLAAFAWLARADLVNAADAIAPAGLAALAGWHGGCVATSSCLGTGSTLPWAYALSGSVVTRHPVELYAAITMAASAAALALWKQHGRPWPLAVTGTALVVAAGTRLATEPMRVSLGSAPITFYAIGVIAGIFVLGFGWARLRSAE